MNKNINQTKLIMIFLISGLALLLLNQLVLKRFIINKNNYRDGSVNIQSYSEETVEKQNQLNAGGLKTLENFEPSDIQVEIKE